MKPSLAVPCMVFMGPSQRLTPAEPPGVALKMASVHRSFFLQLAKRSLCMGPWILRAGYGRGNGLDVREGLFQLIPDGIGDLVFHMQPLLEDRVTKDWPFHAVLLSCHGDFIFLSMIHGLWFFTGSRRQAFLEGQSLREKIKSILRGESHLFFRVF